MGKRKAKKKLSLKHQCKLKFKRTKMEESPGTYLFCNTSGILEVESSTCDLRELLEETRNNLVRVVTDLLIADPLFRCPANYGPVCLMVHFIGRYLGFSSQAFVRMCDRFKNSYRVLEHLIDYMTYKYQTMQEFHKHITQMTDLFCHPTTCELLSKSFYPINVVQIG